MRVVRSSKGVAMVVFEAIVLIAILNGIGPFVAVVLNEFEGCFRALPKGE